MPRVGGAAIQLQVWRGQQGHFADLEVFDLIGRHLVLHFAIRQELHAVGVGGVIVDGLLVDAGDRFVEKALWADVPVADGHQQGGNHTEQRNSANFFTEHVSLYR
ncbi:hypothetical protein D3C81_1561530 [compost metagenome]